MSNEETTTDNVTRTPDKAITTFGTLDRETANAVRYGTGWGTIYVPKTQLAKLQDGGYPQQIKFTVEAVTV